MDDGPQRMASGQDRRSGSGDRGPCTLRRILHRVAQNSYTTMKRCWSGRQQQTGRDSRQADCQPPIGNRAQAPLPLPPIIRAANRQQAAGRDVSFLPLLPLPPCSISSIIQRTEDRGGDVRPDARPIFDFFVDYPPQPPGAQDCGAAESCGSPLLRTLDSH
jgi:hypothetical protein